MNNSDITIVSVCVDFDDYLSLVLKSWLDLNCHEIIIVTTNDDVKTIELCNKHGLKTVLMPRETWIRGRYLNAGMKEVKTEWTLILDADCWIPKLDIKDLDDNNFYGLPFVPMSPKDLVNYKTRKNEKTENIRHRTTGVGFFQLFNTKIQRKYNSWYTEKYNVSKKGIGASVKFRKRWGKPTKLSDQYVICISNGSNRYGRKTNRIPKNIEEPCQITKIDKFKMFTNGEIGITIYERKS